MTTNPNIAQAVESAVAAANTLGTDFGFEMAKLAVVSLLWDEISAATKDGRSVTPYAELMSKVKALRTPGGATQGAAS